MKRGLDAQVSPSSAPYEIISAIQAESPPAEMAADSSNDLGEKLIKLPIELKQMIICSLTPKERSHLRLVNKAMMDIVDSSVSCVQYIHISIAVHSNIDSYVNMSTINPYNGAKDEHFYRRPVPSSLPFLLKWAGGHLKTLAMSIHLWMSEDDDSNLMLLYPLFETLNSESICPKLENLRLTMNQSVWDNNEMVLNELQKYVTMRQLQAMSTDHPILFLHSLTLTDSPDTTSSDTPTLIVLHREKRRKFLQDLLDQCHGLKELDVDDLLLKKDLPLAGLRYPATLTHLISERLINFSDTLQTIFSNCPNLQIVKLNVGFLRDDAEVHALAPLSDLRELFLEGDLTEEKIVEITAQCFEAFEGHPFGASVARPWPQLRSVILKCRRDVMNQFPPHRLVLSGRNGYITSLHLIRCPLWYDSTYAQSVQQLFIALNCKNACPKLMELNISTCALINRIADSLTMKEDREPQAQEQQSDDFYDGPPTIPIPSPQVSGMLNNLLAYVTKRQSEVRLGKSFLRSFSIGKGNCFCGDREDLHAYLDGRRDQLKQIHATVQQILDQCQGLEVLYLGSLEDQRINPSKKKGKELMESVDLRFPSTLNDARLD